MSEDSRVTGQPPVGAAECGDAAEDGLLVPPPTGTGEQVPDAGGAGTDAAGGGETGGGEPQESADVAAESGTASLVTAFGGVRGMIDMTVPGLVFVLVYTIFQHLPAASLSALGLTVTLGVLRVLRRESLQHAFGGVLGVGIGAFIAWKSGNAEDFYLPGMIYGVVLGVVYLVSNLVRWPLIGLLLGPILGENTSWRTRNPARRVAYTKATWVWVALFAVRAVILFPLYWAGSVTWLGAAKVGLGVPLWLVAIYLTWLVLSKAPPPIKVAEPLAGRGGRASS